MKELDDFTVERLERIAERRSGIMPTMREIAALARIALAAKTAQPLCVEIQMNDADLLRRLEEMTKWRSPAEPILMPVFESNSPELPDGWILIPAKASIAHLKSIACRYRHDFYLLDDNQKDSALSVARQMYEECSGQGFFTIPAPTTEK